MSGWMKWKTLIAAALLALAAGCATDVPVENNEDGRTDPNSCSNPCEAGETQCNGSSVEACAADAQGCFRWVAGVDCAADGSMCDDSAEPAICLTEPGTCQDGAVNQDESDVDCGGQRCASCPVGKTCDTADDCQTNNCDLGVTDTCVPEDQPTCTDGEKTQDETDVDCGGGVCPACQEAQACSANEDCASNICDNGTCAPGGGPCDDGEVQCASNTVQTCDQGQWVESQICAQACTAGVCDGDVQCDPMGTRCFKNSVQTCNATGTAWQHLDICDDECSAGLCVGACAPGALRCNGGVQESCGPDGMTWEQQEDCSLGCSQRVCVEDKLSNQGVPMTMSGVHVYDGCVDVELGGSIEVPAGETLEMWGRCLNVTSSSSIVLGADAEFIFHASQTIVNAGTVSGGAFVRLDAYQSLTNSGDVSANRVELRGDVLTNQAGGTIGGSYSYALYGSEWENDGAHDGDESVMPPETLSSPTHPEGFQWNMTGDDVSIAWNKPFGSVRGYYINVNSDEVPAPDNAEFTDVENVTLPLSMFRPGFNEVSVVTVNDDSTVGTIEANFEIDFNVSTPILSSTSHEDPDEWSSTDDVFLEWTEASSVDPNSYVGYWYAWDHRGDTWPDEITGTFRADTKILFDGQASGVWKFHLVSIDRLGRTSRPGRYEVRVGPDPGAGNIAGSITDASGDSLRGASILLNGGLYRATSVSSGDYTFRGEVPAAAFDWDVVVNAPGYTPKSATIRVSDGASEILDFALTKSNQPATYELGYEIELDSDYASDASQEMDIALGRPGEVIWSTSNETAVSSNSGTMLRRLSSATSYYGERVEVGYDGGHYFTANTAYCGSYRYCPRVEILDARHNPLVNRTISEWDDYYGPSMVWDGARFVAIGATSSLYFGAVDVNDPDTPGESIAVSSAYYSGSSNRTKALHDGTAIAVATQTYRSSAGEYMPVFGRWTRDGTEVQAPVDLGDQVYAGTSVGLAYDGDAYHVTWVGGERKTNDKYPLYMQSVDNVGGLGPLTELEDSSTYYTVPMVAFDGRNLLVAYVLDGNAFLEVRDPSDYAIVQSFNLGAANNVNLDFGFHAGKGAVILSRNTSGAPRGVFMREINVF